MNLSEKHFNIRTELDLVHPPVETKALHKELEAFCFTGLDLFLLRNTEYGGAALDAGGFLGALMSLDAVVRRLKVLRLQPSGMLRDSRILDALLDAHNYSEIAYVQAAKGNWQGEY